MKPSNYILLFVSLLSAADAIAVPGGESAEARGLFKRKGGGGGGGRGGSTGSSSSKSSSSSSSSSVGKSSSTSNVGGKTTTGSGVTPGFGGGRFYAGGAKVPYKSGNRGPTGLLPVAMLGGAMLFWSGAWLAGAHMYPYTHHYTFHNYTADPEKDETLPVYCICQPYVVCGCADTEEQVWLDDIIGNGSYAALNDTLVFVGEVNGTKGIYINGTLPNGTTAAGGTEDPNAAIHLAGMINTIGFWPVAVAVGAAVFM